MVKRLENWPRILGDYLRDKAAQPFEWGVNDCMSFVCQLYEKMTGEIVYPEFAGYHNEEEAKSVVESHGGIIEIINRFLGENHSNQLAAQRGDIVIVRMPEVTGGIIDDTGQRIAVVTPQGLIRLPLSSAVRIWSY